MDLNDLINMPLHSSDHASEDVPIFRVPGGWIYSWDRTYDTFVPEPKDSQQIRKELHESYGKILTAKQDLIQDLESKLRDSGLECSKLRRKVETLENIVINKGGD